MRLLLITALVALLSTSARSAEAFPAEGWWGVETLAKVAANVSVLFRLERFIPPKSIPLLDGSPDHLAILRERPKEAWLLTIYQAEISVNAADHVQLSRSAIPTRITGNTLSLLTPSNESRFEFKSTEEGAELEQLNIDGPNFFVMTGGRKVKVSKLTPEAIERLKQQVLKFFP